MQSLLGRRPVVSVPALLQEPGVTPEGMLQFYGRRVAGRGLPKFKGSAGVDSPIQPALFGNYVAMINCNNGASLNVFATGTFNTGTVTHPAATEQYGFMANFASAATALATAGTGFNMTTFRRGTGAGGSAGFFNCIRLALPDVSYSGARVVAGMTSQTLAAAAASDTSNAAGGHCALFEWSGPRGDVNWQFATRNGAAATITNTGLPFLAEKVYDVFVYSRPSGDRIFWRIDNVSDGVYVEGEIDSNLPGDGTSLRPGLQVWTPDAVARNIRMQRIYCESDR